MHPTLVRRVVFPYAQRRMGRRIGPALDLLERTQWSSPEEVSDLQVRRLRALLRHAGERVPYYRGLFRTLGLRPDDDGLGASDALAALPVLTKETIRDRGRELLAEGMTGLSERRTSGSTGIPLRTYLDRRCWESWLAAEIRSRRWWGIEVGDRMARLTTDRLPRRVLWKRRVMQNHGYFLCADLSEEALRSLYRAIGRFRPAFLYGISATSLAHFARFLVDQGLAGPLGCRVVISTGELLYPSQREVIARAFECPVVDEYGSTETWLMAMECPHGAMHIMAENVFLEYRAVAPGITELLVTDLNNYGMPLIRYAIGDLAEPVAGSCACGRGLPLLRLRGGRTSDLAMRPDGSYFDSLVLCDIFESRAAEGIRQYRIIQDAPDRLTAMVAAAPDDALAGAVKAVFARALGPAATVTVQFVDAIPPEPSGKLRHFVSKIRSPESNGAGADPRAVMAREGNGTRDDVAVVR